MTMQGLMSKALTMLMICGNEVANCTGSSKRTPGELATPCNASDHLHSTRNVKQRSADVSSPEHSHLAPFVERDVERGNSVGVIVKEADLVVGAQPRHQVLDARRKRLRRVAP